MPDLSLNPEPDGVAPTLGSLLLVGCGNMGGAMLAGWLAAGMAPTRVTICDPGLTVPPEGVTLVGNLAQVAGRRFDALLIGVKPQALDMLVPDLAPIAGTGTLVLSLLAGTELGQLATRFPNARGIVRVMPNLAVAIGKAPVALATSHLDGADRDAVTALMTPLGTPEWFADDRLFHALTALAGSGPAFVYRFIDALAEGAAALGLAPEQANRLALAMVEGAALLAARAPEPPAELARKVASPGGTTEAGLAVLDADAQLAELVAATLRAASDRSEAIAANTA